MPRDLAEFKPLFQGLRRSFLAGGDDKATISSYEEWKQGALAGFAKGDGQLQALMRDEKLQVPHEIARRYGGHGGQLLAPVHVGRVISWLKKEASESING